MTRVHKALMVCGLAAFGLWGCGKSPPPPAADTRHLEAKVAKLEEDLKATSAARDTFRTKLAATEDKVRAAEDRLRAEAARGTAAEQERDRVAVVLKTVSGDRDQLRGQFEAFRTQIRDLLGKTETAVGVAIPTATPVSGQKPAGVTTGS